MISVNLWKIFGVRKLYEIGKKGKIIHGLRIVFIQK